MLQYCPTTYCSLKGTSLTRPTEIWKSRTTSYKYKTKETSSEQEIEGGTTNGLLLMHMHESTHLAHVIVVRRGDDRRGGAGLVLCGLALSHRVLKVAWVSEEYEDGGGVIEVDRKILHAVSSFTYFASNHVLRNNWCLLSGTLQHGSVFITNNQTRVTVMVSHTDALPVLAREVVATNLDSPNAWGRKSMN